MKSKYKDMQSFLRPNTNYGAFKSYRHALHTP